MPKRKALPARRCQAAKRDNTRCVAPALANDAYCYNHSPRMAKQRTASRRKGGLLSRTVTKNVDDVQPPKLEDKDTCLDYVREVAYQCHTGQISPGVAKVLLQAIDVALRTHDLEGLEMVRELKRELLGRAMGRG